MCIIIHEPKHVLVDQNLLDKIILAQKINDDVYDIAAFVKGKIKVFKRFI